MNKITDDFSGYLDVGDDTFTFTVSNHIVILLPAQSEPFKRQEVLKRIDSYNTDTREYLFGVTDSNHSVAILRNSAFVRDMLMLTPSIRFGAPVIIKASGNTNIFFKRLTSEWDSFHTITFWGGNINPLYNPQMAVKKQTFDSEKEIINDGSKEIELLPWDDYTRTVDLEIDGERVTLTISVRRTGGSNVSENMGSYNLGMLDSFLRFSFETAQGFDKIAQLYEIARSLIAVLTMQNNIFFDVYLSQRTPEDQYFKTGVCKISDHYANYSARNRHQVISINSIIEHVPNLIEKIANKEVEPLLALLPEDNEKVNLISITNVQDLCTALEVAYGWKKRNKKEDNFIVELKKEIKKTIKKFTEKNDILDVYSVTTLSSAFQYLDYTLKQKILILYKENSEAVDAVISRWSLPGLDEDSVGSFVKLRNSKTHSGEINWGDNAELYTALFALKYACLFRYIGLPNEKIKDALLQIF